TKVVCPYAFWGMGRTVARTFRVEHGTAARSPLVPLSLTPVLYAAAARADAESPDDARPSDLLQQALSELVGPAALTRVTSWRAWRSAVKSGHPQLLVVLGHTETAGGEMTIEIGEESRLARPDVSTAVLRGKVGPPPLVVLLACASAAAGDTFGGLPAAFTGRGAAAVVATLSKLKGPHGASAAAAVIRALRESTTDGGVTLGRALTTARRRLIADGVLVGLLLVAHGEIDLLVTT
ncbi:MAG: CHAT domain-containing protein, partial [Actinomycetota bacterium]|nr:CHAT domain-containing protein [Actinomycetota bacterium]